MPVSGRHLEMNALKVLRVTMESGRWALKKSLSWQMSRTSLASKRARMTANGQMDASSLQDLRQMGGVRLCLSWREMLALVEQNC
jgi:hypothetical protein